MRRRPQRFDPQVHEILDEFWTNQAIGDLPYRRGDLLAVAIDEEIRRRSKGEKSLDDIMRELVKRTTEHGEKVDTESLLALFEENTSEEFARMLRGVVIDGKTLELPERLQEPALVREIRSVQPFDLGFDFEASKAARTIAGIDPDSQAFEAGLRDGQAIKGWSVNWGQTDKPVVIRVEIEGRLRRIRYLPVGKAMDIPFYRKAD